MGSPGFLQPLQSPASTLKLSVLPKWFLFVLEAHRRPKSKFTWGTARGCWWI